MRAYAVKQGTRLRGRAAGTAAAGAPAPPPLRRRGVGAFGAFGGNRTEAIWSPAAGSHANASSSSAARGAASTGGGGEEGGKPGRRKGGTGGSSSSGHAGAGKRRRGAAGDAAPPSRGPGKQRSGYKQQAQTARRERGSPAAERQPRLYADGKLSPRVLHRALLRSHEPPELGAGAPGEGGKGCGRWRLGGRAGAERGLKGRGCVRAGLALPCRAFAGCASGDRGGWDTWPAGVTSGRGGRASTAMPCPHPLPGCLAAARQAHVCFTAHPPAATPYGTLTPPGAPPPPLYPGVPWPAADPGRWGPGGEVPASEPDPWVFIQYVSNEYALHLQVRRAQARPR